MGIFNSKQKRRYGSLDSWSVRLALEKSYQGYDSESAIEQALTEKGFSSRRELIRKTNVLLSFEGRVGAI